MPNELIMLVEDNNEIRESVASILEVNGFQVIACPQGEEALRYLGNGSRIPDLIISDIRMPPGMNGYEFLDQIREQERLENVPFIFLTALGEEQHVTFGWNKGIDGYIIKPFQPDRFLATIRNRITRNRQIQDVADKQLNRTRHALLQVLSHELRTPLTYVLGGMSLLEEDLIAKGLVDRNQHSSIKEVMDVINSGTARLFRVAEQTSILGELMSGYASTHWGATARPLSVHSLVRQALHNIVPHAQTKNISFEFNPNGEIEVVGIEQMLVKGIYEVLHNAVQYSEKNSVAFVEYYQRDDRAFIRIEDRGRGIPTEDIEHVWKMLSQSQREKYEHQGMGLGLTLTKGIFELHGGDATLESEAGMGTVVWLELPVRQPTI